MKKRVLVCSIATLAVLLACSVGLTEDKARGKKKNVSQKQKEFREKLKAMSPQERKVVMAKKAFENTIAPWRAVRKVALAEKATKTVAAIDKVIAAKEAQLKKKLAPPKKPKKAAAKKPKDANAKKPKRQRKAKAKDKTATGKK